MVYQTNELILHTTPDPYFIAFVFFATICSYSFHWYLTPAGIELASSRSQWLSRNKNVHVVLIFYRPCRCCFFRFFFIAPLALAATIRIYHFSLFSPQNSTSLFQGSPKSGIGQNRFSCFCMDVCHNNTSACRSVISPGKRIFLYLPLSRFFLIYAICILFDYRDREYDKNVGIRSLITWLSDKSITRLFIVSLLLFTIFSSWLIRIRVFICHNHFSTYSRCHYSRFVPLCKKEFL